MNWQLGLLSSVLVLGVGCASPELVFERGWVGASFEDYSVDGRRGGEAVPEGGNTARLLLPADRDEVVLVSKVFPGTPSAQAGLQPGDVILALDGKRLGSAKGLQSEIDSASPGSEHSLCVYRFGETIDKELKVGVEKFRRRGTISFGIGFSSGIDVVPDPNINVLGQLVFHKSSQRAELQAPRNLLSRHLFESASDEGDWYGRNGEGFYFHFILFGVGRRVEVISQECSS
ncbi:MAG: PDZ domain-containing protein [Planctomycetes bacterium]|nr:PDZ domain-containing protein [Planctomycetota bacterium]